MRFEPHAKLFLIRGASYQKLGQTERALQDFDEAVKMKPEAGSFAVRGLLLKDMGRLEKAADDLDEAIKREPGNEVFRRWRGDLLLELGREDAALHDFDEAVRLVPDKAESYFSRGAGRLIAGRDTAADDFRAALRLKGWHHEMSAACVLEGYVAELLAGRPAGARSFLDEAIARCDKRRWPHSLLLCLRGDLSEADCYVSVSNELQRTEARVCIGIKRFTEGRRDEGLRDLRAVCKPGAPSSVPVDIARAVLRRAGEHTPGTD
jgi:tetratricopeptide (TPR) repeat protein